MITVYLPGETTAVLIREYRSIKKAKESFSCDWFINRDENMNFVLTKGSLENKRKIKVCLMISASEQLTNDQVDTVAGILSKIAIKYGQGVENIRFGYPTSFRNIEGPIFPTKAKPLALRLKQAVKISMECIAV